MPGMACELTLIAVTRANDAYQKGDAQTRTTVYAEELPMFGSEYHASRAGGYELAYIMRIHTFEYNGEKTVEYEGRLYDVYRCYKKNADWCELYLTDKRRQ